MTQLEKNLFKALQLAVEHLEWTGYGDSWERECATFSKLPERLNTALQEAEEAMAKEETVKDG